MDREVQFSLASVSVGDQLGPIEIPITLQRLVMEAGANRDFSLIHHDKDVAQATGAADAYTNTFFIAGMFERLLRELDGARRRPEKDWQSAHDIVQYRWRRRSFFRAC